MERKHMATTRANTSRSSTSARTRKQADTVEIETETKIQIPDARKPLYASLGAADLAVEKLLNLPSTYTSEIRRITNAVNDLSAQAQKLPGNAATVVKALPTAVTAQLSGVADRANALYDSFATRGEKRVASIRGSESTEEAVTATKTAVSRTKAARTSTRKAAGAVGKAVGDATPGR
jgi:hypothetical protein